ncbi:TPA: acid phosphatase [Serratia liquefaciens]|uniref:acid phosphatase n=1 Tax=Serratia liquefaciens TaxID=614 RepID=UPI000D51C519|nr:acid phosphatase [Serratia liquefaciens]PVD45205.1 acid phosphatase [Serratia liquefaciens]QHT50117.1 acid phosphatase [Serratia liquefaciens]HEJ8022749.1 acid phosphatase [Serratia liquefaciens]
MSDKPQNDLPPSAQDQQQQPSNPARRRFLAGATALGVGASIAPLAGAAAEGNKKVLLNALPQSAQNSLLRRYVKNVVVIYAENRSFNNLFANFPGVEKPLSALKPEEYQQRDRDGQLLDTLPPIWKGLVPKAQEVGHVNYKIDEDAVFTTQLPNQPFVLAGPQGENLPHGVVTRDLWHVFYQNQMQINGGKNDKFVAWADSGALTMGYYGDGAYNLRLWTLAQEFTLCDNFFQGAFGGSFLNHQYLICARPPFYPDVQNSVAKDGIAQLESDDVTDWRLKPLSDSPVSASFGIPLFGKSLLTPDGYAVNTMAPPYWPSWTQDEKDPTLADATMPNVMPPQKHPHIGDLLSQKGIDWAWYAGGWQYALDNRKDQGDFPGAPDFQYHHQPFNYFENLGPANPQAREAHLRDGGIGDSTAGNKFLAAVEAGTLPPVAFYKPQGNLNMHAGYSDVEAGDRHIAHIINSLRNGPQWDNSVVVITFDENGGWWDHVAPPQGDRWGPGSRIPALVISPFARKGYVDHQVYDTGSILRFISRVFDLPTLEGLADRDKAMATRGQKPLGDLTGTLEFPG